MLSQCMVVEETEKGIHVRSHLTETQLRKLLDENLEPGFKLE